MASTLATQYPNDHLLLKDGEWLIADEGTAQTVAEKIGVGKENATNGALVVSVSSYYGRQQPNVWEWIAAKWGANGQKP